MVKSKGYQSVGHSVWLNILKYSNCCSITIYRTLHCHISLCVLTNLSKQQRSNVRLSMGVLPYGSIKSSIGPCQSFEICRESFVPKCLLTLKQCGVLLTLLCTSVQKGGETNSDFYKNVLILNSFHLCVFITNMCTLSLRSCSTYTLHVLNKVQ